MTRTQAEKKIREKWGFLPYGGVALSLYEMDEEVPDSLVEYELRTNPHRAPATFIIGSAEVVNAINELNQSKDE